MTFARREKISATRIGMIAVHLIDPAPLAGKERSGYATVKVHHDDGSAVEIVADLRDHLPNATLVALNNLLDDIRAKAEAEILPTKEAEA